MVISLLKRGAALLTLLALVVGAPYLLWVLGRDLLPDRVPGWSDIWESLTAQDTNDREFFIASCSSLRSSGCR